MTPKSLVGLGIVTVVAVVAAVVSVAKQYTATQPFHDESPVVSGLEDKLNSIAEFSVKTADGAFTIHRKGKIWTMADKGDYPVNGEAVSTMLFQLSQLRLAEPKTKMPERYSRLDVEDVTTKGAKSALLTVKDGAGHVLADLIIGKSESEVPSIDGAGVYLRRPGEAQSWLARGAFEMPKTAAVWLVRKIVDIDGSRIRRIATVQPGGERLVVLKEKPTDSQFTIQGLPKGKKVKDGALDDFGTALAGLDLGDVMPAAQKPLPPDKSTRAEISTFDGLVISIVMEKSDKGVYARFKATTTAPVEGAAKAADAGKKIDVAKEAQEINARVANWVYLVPEYKLDTFFKKRSDLIKS